MSIKGRIKAERKKIDKEGQQQMKKRILALCMAVAVTFTTVTSDVTVYAGQSETVTESETESGVAEDNTSQIEAETETETQELESTEEETKTQELESTEEETKTQELESTEEETKTRTQELESTEEETQTPKTEQDKKEAAEKLNYLSVGSPYVELPGTQKIVADFGDEDTVITSATMVVQKKDTLETQKVEVSEISDTALLFELAYQDESSTGVYKVVSLHVETKKGNYDLNLEEIGIDAQYGVNQSVDTKPDSYVVDEDEDEEEDISSEIVSIGPNGEYKTETTLEDALESVQASSDFENVKGNLVVCLDPGHGGYDGGASANGLVEKNLNLKIAQYVKEELETYSGVTVYMTRTGDNYLSLDQRGAYAQQVGANVFVSIHINSGSSVASGAEVYYPNGSYNPTVGAIGHDLAEKILAKLVALGLANRGTKIRNSESGDTYDDGSLCDYYGVIRRAKKAGIPGLIVEHAFVSNASDASNFLNSDEKLKALGVADATGIAEYYGLVKKNSRPTISYTQSKKGGKLKVKWSAVDSATSYQVYRSTEKDGEYTELATVTGTTSYTDTSVKVGTKYYYKVCAVFSDGTKGQYSDPVSGRALAQANITGVKANGSMKLQISWKKVSGASGYYIYRKNNTTGQDEQIAKILSGSTLTYTDSVGASNEKFYYKVRAYSVNAGKEGVGTASSEKYGKAIERTAISYVKSKNATTLRIHWKQVTGAAGYTIKRSTSKNGKYEKIKTITSSDTVTYDDTSVKAGKTYYYKVEAYNTVKDKRGYSGSSDIVSGKTAKKTKITSVKSYNATGLTISWEKVSGACGYRVKRSTSKNGTYRIINTVNSGDTTSYRDTGVTTGKKYYYKVESINKNNGKTGYSGDSGKVYGKTIAKTSIGYVISKNSSTLEISWKEVSDATGYKIKRSDSKDGKYKTIATIKDGKILSYRDKKLDEGKYYYYKIECINNVNGEDGSSGNSKAVSGKTLESVKISAIRGTSSTSLKIKWKKLDGVTGYQIYRSASKNGSYKNIASLNGNENVSYVDSGLQAGQTYYYKIRACYKKDKNSYNEIGSFSKVQKAWTVNKVNVTKVTEKNSNSATITWEKVENASGYSVYRRLKGESSYSKIGTISSGSTVSFTDKTVKAGKIYYYKICANSFIYGTLNGRGNYSEANKIAILETTSIGSLTLNSESAITASWQSIKNADGYQIACSTSENGSYTSLKKTTSTSYTHTGLTSGSTYYYKVRAYVKLADGSKTYGAWSAVKSQTAGYLIMGKSDLTVEDMLAYYNKKGYTYPASVYISKGASSAKIFFEILKEEAEAEGVKTEVLFAQVILETGGLQFGGDVKAEQCNFGGLGAVGGGASGETYANVRTGLKAQVQHLKAYASTEDLNNTCVDTRFKYVTRGTAPYVEWLSIPNNPYGKGWATDSKYAAKLLNIINSL